MWFLYILPKKHLSYWAGKLMHLSLPGFLRPLSIKLFGEYYQIRFEEAEKPYHQYDSIGDFFVRKLKPGIRPLSESPILHPADSRISQAGEISEGRCLQAKDKSYSLAEFCGDQALAEKFKSGLFVTYYLCPTDYHRVHSPLDGQIKRVIHIPGQLWPVNSWSTENISNLFAVNERVVLEIESRLGPCLLVFVGATNVGQIHLSFDPEIVTNISGSPVGKVAKVYNQPIEIQSRFL
jgi:phosphatidylserine decarboxylase